MTTEPLMPGARYAMNVIHPGSPALRVRYRQGVLIDPYGFPDWLPYARALVELPPPIAELTVDEQRVWDVLAANQAMRGQDPIWPDRELPLPGATPTPAGWCWAHLPAIEDAAPGAFGDGRRMALLPIELHGAFRHAGGGRILPLDWRRRGVRSDDPPVPVGGSPGEPVPDGVLDDLERLLGFELPDGYRRLLAAGNGAAPAEPGVLAGVGFVADQPFFGLARRDVQQDLSHVPDWLSDRFTPDLLAIGYVQGGLLAVRVANGDVGSVWHWDDDDPRDRDDLTAQDICERLLYRCADDMDEFWARLHRPAAVLLEVAAELVAAGQVRPVRHESAGELLPAASRAPSQPPSARRGASADSFFE